MLTIRHYRIFQAVAEYANMSEAAKQLYVSQPTISQTILDIEAHYGVKLFERYPKNLYITDAGKRLLNYVNPLIYSFENVSSLSLDHMLKYPLRIGATYTVSSCILDDILKDAKKRNHNLDFCVNVANTQIIEQKLLKNELDFAIVEGIIKSKDIITMPIADDCLVLVCGKDHPFAQRDRVDLKSLNDQDFILRETGSGTRKLFESQMASKQINYRVKWECSSFDTVKAAVIENEGIAVISARLIHEELESGQLFVVYIDECIWKRDFFLCYHKSKTLTPEMQPFMNATVDYKIKGVKCPIVKHA
ncbi:MAG: LysR family transcriptional regulator [Hungatella sp.]